MAKNLPASGSRVEPEFLEEIGLMADELTENYTAMAQTILDEVPSRVARNLAKSSIRWERFSELVANAFDDSDSSGSEREAE